MIDPLVIGENIEYIAESDRLINDPKPTVWIIGPLDSFKQAKITSTFVSVEMVEGLPEVKTNKGKYSHTDFTMVKYGLKGFKNFGDIEFKTEKIKLVDEEIDVVTDDILKRIPLPIIHELADVIWRGNKVGKKLRKN